MGSLTLGIDIGQRVDPTALVLAEQDVRPDDPLRETHFTVRYLTRLPLGTPYPQLVSSVQRLLAQLRARGAGTPKIYADATGVGLPVVDMLKQRRIAVVPVLFNQGDKKKYEAGRISLGKAYLVSRLQALLQGRRLHLPKTEEAAALAEELLHYEIHTAPDGDFLAGAFMVGTHDDLVTALGLATLVDAPILSAPVGTTRPSFWLANQALATEYDEANDGFGVHGQGW